MTDKTNPVVKALEDIRENTLEGGVKYRVDKALPLARELVQASKALDWLIAMEFPPRRWVIGVDDCPPYLKQRIEKRRISTISQDR